MTHNIGRVDVPTRRARIVTLASLGMVVLTSLIMPGVGVLREHRPLWIVLGALGVLAFAGAQAGALYATLTPWLTEKTRRLLLTGFGVAAVLSIPLVAPVGNDRWATWAWVAGSIVGSMPLLRVGRWLAVLLTALTFVAAAGTAWWTAGSVIAYVLITACLAVTVAAVSVVHIWLWDLLLQVQAGRDAQARLAATEERLRFARDVHDVLGHDLSVITLKAELAARLAPADADAAAREAGEVRQLAAAALLKMREAVNGYRVVDLRAQLTAIGEVLRSSGVRCTITHPGGDLPQQLAPVLREASTNMLRHSQASWCTIDVTRDGEEVRMTISNDGARPTSADRHSSGLAGLADRLAESGGRLRTGQHDGVFTLQATVRA